MPGDDGFDEWLLCLAQKIDQTAVFEKKTVGWFNEKLLFCEPKTLRRTAYQQQGVS